MGKIPETLIQEILDKTDVAAVFQERVKLAKKGGKLWGLCPFHGERTPSFSVDPERGLFYCFGCHKGGSLVDFVMETESMTFPEAIAFLAERAHVELVFDTGSAPRDDERQQLLSLYEKLATAFHWLLTEHESGMEALAILKKRGLGTETIKTFRLGFAPASREWLKRFLSSKGYSEAFLAKSGLFSARSPDFPLFADRIMFPISDLRGRVIAFGGRSMHDDGPKYINSPETLLFKKQETLFALDKARQPIRSANAALICEGYMDAISFHAAGIQNAVAPLGTAFTQRQAGLLRRSCDRVLLCFDSDAAGIAAAEKACVTAAKEGLEASVVTISQGKDASEILEKSGPDALKKTLEYSINSGDFLVSRAISLNDISTVEGKSRAARYLFPYIEALDSEVKKNAFMEYAGRMLGVNPVSLQADFTRNTGESGRPIVQTELSRPRETVRRSADLMLMGAVALEPCFFQAMKSRFGPEALEDPLARELYGAMDRASGSEVGLRDAASLLTLLEEGEARRALLALVSSGELEGVAEATFEDGMKSLEIRMLEKERSVLISEISKAHRGQGGQSSLPELLSRKMRLDSELARLRGGVDE